MLPFATICLCTPIHRRRPRGHRAWPQAGALVAIWMTNRERHWRFMETEFLPAFQLTRVATWLWLKVTDSGEPVSQLVRALRRCV